MYVHVKFYLRPQNEWLNVIREINDNIVHDTKPSECRAEFKITQFH